jgi:hypothetical protein
MQSFIITLHSYLAWAVLLLVVFTLGLAANVLLGKKTWTAAQQKWAFYAMLAVHIQLLIGLIVYFVSPYGLNNLSGATMKDSAMRLLALEHPLINIIGILMITIGHGKAKRALGTAGASKTILIYYGIGILLILSRIPWNQWL